MTTKEAMDKLKSDLFWKNALKYTKDTGHEPEGNEKYLAYKMAIEALQKQEPKKPRKNDGGTGLMFWKMQTYTCPSCGNVCLTQWMNERNKLNYCWDCGQRINWEGIANE